MNKYIKIYFKRNTFLALILGILVWLPLFIVSLISDVLSYDLLVSFVPFFIGFAGVAVSALTIPRFRKMIDRQEALYHSTFPQGEAQHLETTLYLSEDWLVSAGVIAMHRKHIHSLEHRTERNNSGTSNKIVIQTVDNKTYTIRYLGTNNIRKIRQWWKV